MAIRAVIFDRDGVLTNFDLQAAATFLQPLVPLSVFELFRRWQQLGEKIGFPTSVTAEALFLRTFWEQISVECKLTAEQSAALAEVDYTHFVVAFPEARQVLAELHSQKLRLGVLSNFALASLERSLAAAGLSSWLDAACAATVIGAAKPDMAAYLSVAKALAVAPKECVFFDDEAGNVAGGVVRACTASWWTGA